VLAGAYVGWAGSLPPEAVEQRLKQTIPDLDLPADQVVTKYISGLLTQAASPSVLNEVAAIMRDFHPAGMKTMVRSLAEANLRDLLPRIDIPTLLLYGDKDVRSPLNVAEDLHAAIAESRLVVIPEAGHLSNTEAAARFNAEIRKFLRSSESRRWRPPTRSDATSSD
jgi:pimeloyl-ACP methyl ester carboxylesterase